MVFSNYSANTLFDSQYLIFYNMIYTFCNLLFVAQQLY